VKYQNKIREKEGKEGHRYIIINLYNLFNKKTKRGRYYKLLKNIFINFKLN